MANKKNSNNLINQLFHNLSNISNKLFFLCIIILYLYISLILILTPPAQRFDYSLFEVYPLFFWFIIGFIFISPFLYLLISSSQHNIIIFHKITAYGLLLISLGTLLLSLYIPLTRGYLMYAGGDTHAHIGVVLDIIDYGSFFQSHYPFSHVFFSICTIITNMPIYYLTFHIIPIFTTFFILSIFCLSRSIGFSNVQVITITSIAIIPIFGHYITGEAIYPNVIAWQMIPLLLLCIYKIGFIENFSKNYFIIGFVVCIIFWYIHPEAIIYLIIILLTIELIFIFSKFFCRNYYYINFKSLLIFLIILLFGFIEFFSSTNQFSNQINTYNNYFIGTDTIEEKSQYRYFFSDASLYRKITILMTTYGQNIFLLLLCLLIIIYFIFYQEKHQMRTQYIMLSVLFFSSVIMVLFFTILGSSVGVHIFRQFKYLGIFSYFLLGFYFSDICLSKNKKIIDKILSIIFGISLILIITFSLGNLYDGPGIGGYNKQVTNQDISGMNLFYENREIQYPISETAVRQHQMRYNHLLYGNMYASQMENIRGIMDKSIKPPYGFGYAETIRIGNQYSFPTYFLKNPPTNPYVRWFLYYDEYFNGITPENYGQLEYDSSVLRIQDGGELIIYLIN